MPADTNQPESGLRILRSKPLANLTRPIILLTWRSYTQHGDALQELQYFVVHPSSPLVATGIVYPANGEEYSGVNPPLTLETFTRRALDRIEVELERRDMEALRAHGHGSVYPQPVVLEEMDKEWFQVFAVREEWSEQWREVLPLVHCPPLKRLLSDLRLSSFNDYEFQVPSRGFR